MSGESLRAMIVRVASTLRVVAIRPGSASAAPQPSSNAQLFWRVSAVSTGVSFSAVKTRASLATRLSSPSAVCPGGACIPTTRQLLPTRIAP